MVMQIKYISFPIYEPVESLTACIGYFDGIHLAHQELIKETVSISKNNNTKSALLTFDPDPWVVIKQQNDYRYLTDFNQRCGLIESLGIELLIIIRFDHLFMNLGISEFIDFIHDIGVRELICGFDFRFGKFAKGTIDDLKQTTKFKTHVIAKIGQQAKFSSTLVTKLIEEGKIEQANEILGHPYQINGIVVKGKQIGRTIGFPTANIELKFPYVIPANGVYQGKVKVENTYYDGLISIGTNPTVDEQNIKVTIEVLILDFNQDIYHKEITVDFYRFIRTMMKFSSKEELVKQINLDLHSIKDNKQE
jgi:riboflavin kinase / FMN adenylyltransferase